ncbi:hypothetical protein GGR55DRAFT_406545 [Xylaria sp. FL0064]|nr:hypothetical protein GGR55DRAFT_406545 [Xylaria sp. FL0064]
MEQPNKTNEEERGSTSKTSFNIPTTSTVTVQPPLLATTPEVVDASRPALMKDLTHSTGSAANSRIRSNYSQSINMNFVWRISGQEKGSKQPINIKYAPPRVKSEWRRTILETLDFPQTGAHQITIKKQHAEACLWFLETTQYADWIDDNKLGNHYGVLWIKGKPGSGKSTLMKFMLSHARRSMKGTTIISFFFNFSGYELQKSTIGLYRSLLLQLLQERPDLQSVFDTANIEIPWSLATLQYLFTTAITKFGRGSLICFIDALDECEESQIEGILRFFGGICQGAVSSDTALRVCFASRHTTELKIPGLEFALQAYGHSIVNYLKHSLKIGHSDVAESIHSEVRKKASGSFKWAELAVSWLNREYAKGDDLNRLLSTLSEFPTDHASLSDAISAYSGKQHEPTSPAADQAPSMKKYSEILSKELDVENPKRVRSRRLKVKTGCNNCK